MKLLGHDSTCVEITYGRTKLHGRIYFSPLARAKAPVLIFHQGMHAWTEETMWVINGAMARGYHVLAFHGPGQGISLRLHRLPFRHDWEVPVKAVFDFADTVARFDMKRATLMGFSFGGALAPRAAAHLHRARALIVNPGILNWGGAMYRHFDRFPGFITLLREHPEAFDRAVQGVTSVWDDAA
jgi:alpha-beta hydrolase superfamily lysophospholipase